MKSFKTLVFAALLMFSIGVHTYAGDVDVPGAKPTPIPQLLTANQDPVVTCTDIHHTEEAATSETSDYLFYEALAALLSVY
jgi:hypothetical protein